MTEETLVIKLNNTIIGYLTHYKDCKNIFLFDEEYLNNEPASRPILSLSFNDLSQTYTSRHHLPPFFSNLLPEGQLRAFIASQLNIHIDDEFSLLSALGHDLPGAVIAEKSEQKISIGTVLNKTTSLLHFSLAGVQIKFSMLKEKSWFTLTKNQLPGDYIIKTPSMIYPNVPENEYSMMKLAEAVGINVSEVQLVQLVQLKNLPAINLPQENLAYAVKRFDRSHHARIHIEDFAQALNIKPQQKYQATNYETMAKFIYQLLPNANQEVTEFLRRLFFNILIGNTDAHLKNWSLIYQDKVTPSLAPVYDLVSTLPYLNNPQLALNFAKQKDFYRIDQVSLKYFAKRTDIPETLILSAAADTVEHFKMAWNTHGASLPISKALKAALKEHWKQLPLYRL